VITKISETRSPPLQNLIQNTYALWLSLSAAEHELFMQWLTHELFADGEYVHGA